MERERKEEGKKRETNRKMREERREGGRERKREEREDEEEGEEGKRGRREKEETRNYCLKGNAVLIEGIKHSKGSLSAKKTAMHVVHLLASNSQLQSPSHSLCAERKLFDYVSTVSTESSKSSCRTTKLGCEPVSIPPHTHFQREEGVTTGSNDEGEAVEDVVTALGEPDSDAATEETPLQSWMPQQRVEGGGERGGERGGEGGEGSVSIVEQIDKRDEAESVFDMVSLLSGLSHDFLNWEWKSGK